MIKLLIIIGFIFLIALVVYVRTLDERYEGKKKIYSYKRKQFFLSRAEHECYDALISAVGNEYHVFPQVHLPTILDSKVIGQNWNGAFRHISQKSVDFVLCDKAYISPKLAIELDDKTHEFSERVERDIEVERILKEAGIPLLRLENHGHFSVSELLSKIKVILNEQSN